MFIENKKKEYTRGDNKIHDKICKHDTNNNNNENMLWLLNKFSEPSWAQYNLQIMGLSHHHHHDCCLNSWLYSESFPIIEFLVLSLLTNIKRYNINFNAYNPHETLLLLLMLLICCWYYLLSFDQFSIPYLNPLLIIQSKIKQQHNVNSYIYNGNNNYKLIYEIYLIFIVVIRYESELKWKKVCIF